MNQKKIIINPDVAELCFKQCIPESSPLQLEYVCCFSIDKHITTKRVLQYSYTKHFINSKVQQFITNL